MYQQHYIEIFNWNILCFPTKILWGRYLLFCSVAKSCLTTWGLSFIIYLLSILFFHNFCISKIYFTKWLPCPSLSPRVCSNSYPLSQWCHPPISSSASLFTFAFNFPESGSFPMSQLFAPGDQRIAASASASVLPMNIQGWFPLGFTIWSLLKCEGLSKVFSSTTVWKHHFFGAQPSLQSNSHIIHDYWKT